MNARFVTFIIALLTPLAASADSDRPRIRVEEATVAQLQAAMASGRITSEAPHPRIPARAS